MCVNRLTGEYLVTGKGAEHLINDIKKIERKNLEKGVRR